MARAAQSPNAIHAHETTNPAEAGSVSERNHLLLAARESESSETEAEQRKSRRLRNCRC